MSNKDRLSICHITTGLYTGGAEAMLHKLIKACDRESFEMTVVSLLDGGKYRRLLEKMGVEVFSVGMRHRMPTVFNYRQLRHLVSRISPTIVQGWMYHGNLAAVACGAKCPKVWNVRHTLYDVSREKRLTRVVLRISKRLSHVPKTVVYNSEVSYWQHVKFGFAADNAEIISNGFDTDAFRPNGDEKAAVRGELNIGNHSCVIGFVARDHPMKDLPTFVCAVRKILRKHGHVVVVVAGRGLDVSNRPLMELSGDRELGDRVICLGEYDKVEKLMRAFDVMVLSSAWGEGFPNVIGEAMATGVPCVATNVGECRTIIGKTGLVVEPQNPEQMAAAVSTLVNLDEGERKILGAAARQRIVEHYSLNKIVEKYQRLYQSLLVMP